MYLLAVDEAGALWLLFESFFDWLGFWGRSAFAVGFLVAVAFVIALLARRKS
jgi:hypothetical protein